MTDTYRVLRDVPAPAEAQAMLADAAGLIAAVLETMESQEESMDTIGGKEWMEMPMSD